MYGQYVTGFKWYIVLLIAAVYRIADVDRFTIGDDFRSSYHLVAGEVGIRKQSVTLEAAGHAHKLGRGHTVREGVIARAQHFATDGHSGRIGLVPTEDANRIERLKRVITIAYQHLGHVKVDRLGMHIRRHESDDFAAISRLRQQVLIAMQRIAELHAIAILHAPRPHDMTHHVDNPLAIGEDGRHVHMIAVVDSESRDGSARRFRIAVRRQVQAHRLTLMICVDAVDYDVAECRGYRGAARIFEHLGERGLTLQFINRRPSHRAVDGDLRTGGRHQ